jgi:uncharacterized membrane protein
MKILIILSILLLTLVQAREFTGTAQINVNMPEDVVLKVCTPNEKYLAEPGRETPIKLYVRNTHFDRSIKKIYLDIEAPEGLNFTFTPDYLENLGPDNYSSFDLTLRVAKNVKYGDYKVIFWIGTDELTGGPMDAIMIQVKPYTNLRFILTVAIIVIVLIAFIGRFVWISRVNKKARKDIGRHKKK